MISVIIPISTEDFNNGMMVRLRPFLKRAREFCPEQVEVIKVINKPSYGRVKAKNCGATKASGDVFVFMDVDCLPSANFLQEVSQKARNPKYIGGGTKYVKLRRRSLGICCAMIPVALIMLFKQITLGAFWIKKEFFFEIGGFREKKYDDIDFAIRMKKCADKFGMKFESLKECFLLWSTRKFDKYGDWHWITGYHTD